jgi:hypothetical protein
LFSEQRPSDAVWSFLKSKIAADAKTAQFVLNVDLGIAVEKGVTAAGRKTFESSPD